MLSKRSVQRVFALFTVVAVATGTGGPAVADEGRDDVKAGVGGAGRPMLAPAGGGASSTAAVPPTAAEISAAPQHKRGADADPHVGYGSDYEARIRAKSAALDSHVAGKRAGGTTLATMNWISGYWQYPQIRQWDCGPSSLEAATSNWGRTPSWERAVDLLDADEDGTRWSIEAWRQDWTLIANGYATGHPMADAATYLLGSDWYYLQKEAPLDFTYDDYEFFRSAFTYDIDVAHATMVNIWEVQDGTRLYGHPNREIFHWITLYGYDNDGHTSWYTDPAGGSPALGSDWNASRWAAFDAYLMFYLSTGRGYAW